MNGYNLSRIWFDFAFSNPELIKPNHCALYFFAIEHCNRLGWKKKFGLPSAMAMEAIGIKSYHTYKATLLDLIKWGFIEMVEISKNQYSSNIIALADFDIANDKANDKALDKALSKHSTKHISKHSQSTVQSTHQSIDSIDKQLNKEQLNKEPINNITLPENSASPIGLVVDENFQSNPDLKISAMKAEQDPSFQTPPTIEIVETQTEVWPTFEDFWDLYDKKRGDKDKVKKKWVKLKQSEKEAIMDYLPRYIQAQPDKQYRKDPATFLNNKSWNDEIISRKQPAVTSTTDNPADLFQRLRARAHGFNPA
jgi:hypothetical protein